MKRRQLFKAIPFSISLISSTSYAESLPNDVEHLFDVAAAKHKRELYNLLASRARPIIYLPDASSRSIAHVLATPGAANREELLWGHGQITYPSATSVLFYSHDGKSLQVWLVSSLGIQSYHKQSISKQQIGTVVTRLRDSLGIESLQRQRAPFQRAGIKIVKVKPEVKITLDQAVTDLTQILIPTPIANKLSEVRHLIVVPVLEIGTVPYAILKPFRNETSLIDKMSISIAPSLFDLGQTLHIGKLVDLFEFPLVVGNPYLPKSANWSIPSLPGAEQEAQTVAEVLNATPLLREKATKAEVISRARYSSFIHIAAHGIASEDNPLSESFLMLSAKRFKLGWWTAKEIQETGLVAGLAVLSACQTGLGKTHDAGIIGLSRAFQLAGVPRVVMSLWNVNDDATSKLMELFVKHLTSEIPSEALRQAMLEVRKSYPNPSHWASFMMFGTPR